MNDRRLVDELRSLPAPDAAAAQARGRELVLAAHAGRPPARRRRCGWTAAALAWVIAAGVLLSAVQGPAVARWVGDALQGSRGQQRAALATLPGGGRLLVGTDRGAWITGQGLTRGVGHTDGVVSWSAFGHYIACACGRTLRAVALDGRVVWTEPFAGAVSRPTWSPDGNRIAFGVGGVLHVSAGDGSGGRAVRVGGRGVSLVALAAWRPGGRHELAIHDVAGRVSMIDTDGGRLVTRVAIGPRAVSLGWSSDGRRLLAASAREARVYDGGGRLVAVEHPPGGTTVLAAQLSPSGRQIAYVLRQPDGREEAVLRYVEGHQAGRVLLAGGVLGDLLFSPDGRWLLVGWRDLDSWMFYTTGPGRTEVRQVSHVAARLGNGKPVVAAWCCGPPSPAGA